MANSDYISREAAIEEQKRFRGYLDNDMLNRLEIAIGRIPAADVRPVKWKSVREYTPETGRYLTCSKSMTTPRYYYCSILSYTDNLESIDEYDFEGERIPGWFDYDSEYGYYRCDNVEWFMPLPPMPLPEPPEEEQA